MPQLEIPRPCVFLNRLLKGAVNWSLVMEPLSSISSGKV